MKPTGLLLVFLCFFSTQLIAQKKSDKKDQPVITQKKRTEKNQPGIQSKTSLGQKKSEKKNEKKISTGSLSKISLEEIVQNNKETYVITSEHISKRSGVRHVYLRQVINGIEVLGTESSIHYDRSGEVIKMNNSFIHNIQSTVKNSSASLSASQAISSVAGQMQYQLNSIQQLRSEGGASQKIIFNEAGISKREIPVKLNYYYREGIGTELVWELSVAEMSSNDWWNFRVDAVSGTIIDKDNWTMSCNILGDHASHIHNADKKETTFFIGPMEEEITNKSFKKRNFIGPIEENNTAINEPTMMAGSYRVYAMPVESPNHGGRTLVANPDDAIASPFGWHDTNGIAGAEFTDTRGNNVDDHKVNLRPDGGPGLLFDYPINLALDPKTFEEAVITNLFYWNNSNHDVLYQYGFDEVSGNFQENNYGNGGLGSDYVDANAQITVWCKATFSAPPGGSNPTMNIYICNLAVPNRDVDLDNGVVTHEYGHGVSNRLTGGPANSGCLNNQEQMGEGWSDYYGLMLTMESGGLGPDVRGTGTYLLGQPANGPGGRSAPYSTNFTVNNFTYGDIPGQVVPHGVGFVWATMLWEMTWEIMGVVPYDPDFYTGTGGNNIALALVTEAMKLQPCRPGFVDGRDAILAADRALYGGTYAPQIWVAFARRGLGCGADQGSSGSKFDGTEAFDDPIITMPVPVLYPDSTATVNLDALGNGIITYNDVTKAPATSCFGIANEGIVGGPVNVSCADTGIPIVLAITAEDQNGNFSNFGGITVNVEDNVAPVAVCQDITVVLDGTGNVSITAGDINNGSSGDCGIASMSVSPNTFDCSNVGPNTVTLTITDDCGNTDTCTATVTVQDNEFPVIYPKPPFYIALDLINGDDTILYTDLITALATDNCAIVSEGIDDDNNAGTPPVLSMTVDCDDANNSPFNVTIEATDENGNRTTATVIVTVEDTSIPVFNPVPDIVEPNDPGVCGATVNYTISSADASCTPVVVTQLSPLSPVSGDVFPVGTTTVTMLATSTSGATNTVTFDITIEDVEDPVAICPEDQTQDPGEGNLFYELPDYIATGEATAVDNCTNPSATTQDPAPGTLLPPDDDGTYTVTITATDDSGNTSECSFELTVEILLAIGDFNIGSVIMYPNPASDFVMLSNPQSLNLDKAAIYDLTGRLVQNVDLTDMGTEISIDVSHLASATYVVLIQGENGQVTKQLIKD